MVKINTKKKKRERESIQILKRDLFERTGRRDGGNRAEGDTS